MSSRLCILILCLSCAALLANATVPAPVKYSRLEVFVYPTNMIDPVLKADAFHSSTVYFEYDLLHGKHDFQEIYKHPATKIKIHKVKIFGNFNSPDWGSPMSGMIPWMQYTKEGPPRDVYSCFDLLSSTGPPMDYGDNVCNSNTLMEIATFLNAGWKQFYLCHNVYWTPFSYRSKTLSFELGHSLNSSESFMNFVTSSAEITYSNIRNECWNNGQEDSLRTKLRVAAKKAKFILPKLFVGRIKKKDGSCVLNEKIDFQDFDYCKATKRCQTIGPLVMNTIGQKIAASHCRNFTCIGKDGEEKAVTHLSSLSEPKTTEPPSSFRIRRQKKF